MTQISGQTRITQAGTSQPLGATRVDGSLAVMALHDNTGLIFLGNSGDGTVDEATGLELAAGEVIVIPWVGSLASLQLDAAVSGEGAAWMRLDV